MAQVIRLPRGGAGGTGTAATPAAPAPLPPTAPKVTQALAYRRSRWSAEGYTLINTVQFSAAGEAGAGRSTTAGAGTRADYRFTDYVSATLDLTSTLPMWSSNTQTVEVGTRLSPLGLSSRVRPFVDARAAYVRMTDSYSGSTPGALPIPINGSENDVLAGSRYSRGMGAIGGAGAEYSLTNRFALTSELSAVRARMSTYRVANLTNGAASSAFWMNTYRFTLGLRFNPVSVAHMAQKSTP